MVTLLSIDEIDGKKNIARKKRGTILIQNEIKFSTYIKNELL